MRGRILCLVLAFFLGFGGMASNALCAEGNPPLQLVAPASPPGPQQGQSAPVTQGQPQGAVTLHDIRGPVELPDSSIMLLWLLIGLALLVIVGLFIYFWKRREKGEKPPSAHDVALIELGRLRSMMNPEQALLYAAQLAEVLRRYVEVRFHIHSTRQTTREFFLGLAGNLQAGNSLDEHHDRLKECLEQCDMAKFAHCIPEQSEMEAMEGAVESFIKSTAQVVDEKGKR
ncbi:MAG: DUF4381 family protein [Proteobacteria bacterium]|nr:DUF4381 family protein [Pseudomonadota bacterium]MBU1648474.1 DUF4381 family protein [Pseudomonadota bacterium]MBU1986454.1 DUF4381 family protein [Pseudomonadota bacterium]